MRDEKDILDELAALCVSPGYVHAIAYLCFRDNMILYVDEMKPEDMDELLSRKRLVRTETSTLIGLMLRRDIDYSMPASLVLEQYISSTEALLEELHHSMSAWFWPTLNSVREDEEAINPFTRGFALREPIFYCGESAYSFQYRDFSPIKFRRDDPWLVENKGFSIQDASEVVHSISRLREEKAIEFLQLLRENASDISFLNVHTLTVEEVAKHARMDPVIVERILSAFAVSENDHNETFVALNDFNKVNAYPLIHIGVGTYLLFDINSLVEALYETPFYWMFSDKGYINTAAINRGLFTEQFAVERLSRVFGAEKVQTNIDIFDSEGNKLGEIDVLVVFGNRAIVLQAKSKRLSLEARRGNDQVIQYDFQKGIQDSSDQAYRCARLLGDPNCTFKDRSGNTVSIPSQIKRIYIICLVSDHYPALSFQAMQFLKYELTNTISPPFVMDVFALDAMTEMLFSPLRLLSYIDRRTSYTGKLWATHELTILSYHLRANLWLSDKQDFVYMEDSISTELDVAMTVRRDGVPGRDTPTGILTRFSSTVWGRMIRAIESSSDAALIDFGFLLLSISEDSIKIINVGIDQITREAMSDGKNHDFTIFLGDSNAGLTIHCNSDQKEVALSRLQTHLQARKYREHAQIWYGVCIRPSDQEVRFGINLDYKWEYDVDLDQKTSGMRRPTTLVQYLKNQDSGVEKVGRNQACPCGSGKKFKKCCMS